MLRRRSCWAVGILRPGPEPWRSLAAHRGAIVQRADNVNNLIDTMESQHPGREAMARDIFLPLVQLGEGSEIPAGARHSVTSTTQPACGAPAATPATRRGPSRSSAQTSPGRRVLRGVSWYSGRDVARCACRNHFAPGSRNDDVVLRLVCVSPIPKQ